MYTVAKLGFVYKASVREVKTDSGKWDNITKSPHKQFEILYEFNLSSTAKVSFVNKENNQN